MPKSKAPDLVDIHVGQRVRAARMQKGMSQSTLGRGLQLTFQQVQKYEKGANRIGSSRLQQIATLLDRNVGWFFEGLPTAGATQLGPQRDLAAELLAAPFGRELAENYLRILHNADRRVVASVCAALAEREPLTRMIAAE